MAKEEAVRSIGRLLVAADSASRGRAAEWILGWLEAHANSAVEYLAAEGVIDSLDPSALATLGQRPLEWATANVNQRESYERYEVALSVLAKLARHGSTEPLVFLREQAFERPDLGALRTFARKSLDLGLVDPSKARDALIERTTFLRNARHVFIGGYDDMALLAWLNMRFPEAASWDALVSILGDRRVPISSKSGTCWQLATDVGAIPHDVREAVAGGIDDIVRSANPPQGFERTGATFVPAVALGIACASWNDAESQRRLLDFLDSSLDEDRRALGEAVWHGRNVLPDGFQETVLSTLAADRDVHTRANAGWIAARLVGTRSDDSVVLSEIVKSALMSDGVSRVRDCLRGMIQTSMPDQFHALVAGLRTHRSAVVRHFADAASEARSD